MPTLDLNLYSKEVEDIIAKSIRNRTIRGLYSFMIQSVLAMKMEAGDSRAEFERSKDSVLRHVKRLVGNAIKANMDEMGHSVNVYRSHWLDEVYPHSLCIAWGVNEGSFLLKVKPLTDAQIRIEGNDEHNVDHGAQQQTTELSA